jgi:hypothetical protein
VSEDAAMRDAKAAFEDLLATLAEVGERFAGPEWAVTSPDDEAEALAVILHHLATGFETQFVQDSAHPVFREIVTPWRKALGDNADARYHDAVVHPAGTYRVRGRTEGAVYVSFTVEAGAEGGRFPTGTVGVLNDADLDVAADGSFAFTLGGPPVEGPWLPLAGDASRITVRHYWEQQRSPLEPPIPSLGLALELLEGEVPPAERPATEASLGAAIRRLSTYVRQRTTDTIARPGEGDPPPFVSREPHVFPPPVPPGDHALAAADAAYSMAPYLLGPSEALVIGARWPQCRCANVSLWNRQMQTFDYLRGPVWRNRANTVVGDDGWFEVVLAHEDPGVANWLSTEGRPFGLVFWRFMLPEGPIETPQARVVQVAELQSRPGR